MDEAGHLGHGNNSQLARILQRHNIARPASIHHEGPSQRPETNGQNGETSDDDGRESPSPSAVDPQKPIVEAINENVQAPRGGQLYRIRRMFEESSRSSIMEDRQGKTGEPRRDPSVDVPCPKGNVASLKARLSPTLFREPPIYENVRHRSGRMKSAPKKAKARLPEPLSDAVAAMSIDDDVDGDSAYEDADDAIYEDVDAAEDPRSLPKAFEEKTVEVDAVTDAELGFEAGKSDADGASTASTYNPVLNVDDAEYKKIRRRLRDAIDELIQTEIKYVNDLKYVIDEYIPMLDGDHILPNETNMTKSVVFANLEEIHCFHANEFLPQLKRNRRNLRRIANMFIKYESVFEMYIEYSSSNKNANGIVVLNKSYFEKKRVETGKSLDLSSYLLSPVQRLPRYVLFLEELSKTYKKCLAILSKNALVKCGSENSVSDDSESDPNSRDSTLSFLELGKEALRRVLKTANDRVALTNVNSCPINLQTLSLICHDEFTVLDTSTRKSWFMRCFLFQELLLLTTIEITSYKGEIYHYHDSIETSKLGITPSESSVVDKICVWSENRMSKNYVLHGSSRVLKSWFDSIISMLWKDAISKKEKIKNSQGKSWTSSLKTVKKAANSEPVVSQNRSLTLDKSVGCMGTTGKVTKNTKKRKRTTWYI